MKQTSCRNPSLLLVRVDLLAHEQIPVRVDSACNSHFLIAKEGEKKKRRRKKEEEEERRMMRMLQPSCCSRFPLMSCGDPGVF